MFKERQLHLQIHAAAAAGPHAWRQASVSAGHSNTLLQRRGLPALGIRVPHAATGVEAADHVVYVRSVDVACRKPKHAAAAAAAPCPPPAACSQTASPAAHAPTAFTCESSLPLPSRLSTPPMQEQRAKRSRLSPPGSAVRSGAPTPAAAAAHPGHLIACACTRATERSAAPVVLAMPQTAAAQPRAAAHGDDPHGVMAWLHKMKAMLSPASRAEPVCVY